MDLSLKIARHLKTQTDELGSTLFSMTWKEHITPAGRSVFRLAVSEPLTEDSVFIGWPTPNARDFRSGMENRVTGDKVGLHAVGLNDWVLLAGWKTPCVPNGGRISGNKMDIGKHVDGTKAQIGLENEAKLSGWTTPQAHDVTGRSVHQKDIHGTTHGCACLVNEAKLGSWPTPMAQTPARNGYNEAGNSDSSRKTVEMCQWPVDQSTDSGAVPIGYLLGPNGWEIVPASGQLNASHSRWLMGLPKPWDLAAITAFRSRKKKKRGSCDLGATETA